MAGAPLHRISGRAYGRPASVEVHDQLVCWRAQRGQIHPEPEAFDIPHSELVIFAVHEDRTSGAAWGVLLVAVAAVWMIYRSTSPLVCLAIALAGAILIALRRLFPTTVLEVRTPELRFVLHVARASAPASWDAAEHMQAHQPRLAGSLAPGVFASLRGELRVLLADRELLRHEFRHRAGALSTAAQEDRFVRVRRRMALWNVAWLIALPLVAAAALQLALPRVHPGWLIFRAALHLVLLFWIALVAQMRLLPFVRRWIER